MSKGGQLRVGNFVEPILKPKKSNNPHRVKKILGFRLIIEVNGQDIPVLRSDFRKVKNQGVVV